MARRSRLRRLTVQLLREGVTLTDALRDRDVRSFRVPVIDPDQDSLFVVAPLARAPWWVDYLDPHVDGSELQTDLVNSSTSAVLLVNAAGRLFAVTFGYGRHLVEPTACEQDFGLRVVLNTVAPDQLKSVDARTVDELTLHTRRDVSRDSTLAAFELDVSRDLVRAVTGKPRDESLARQLAGADALALSARVQVPELRALCSRLLDAYQSDEYKAHFDFIDHLRRERVRVPELEAMLLAALQSRALDDIHLAVPEPIDWINVAGLRFSTQAAGDDLVPDPRISAYLDSRGDQPVDVAALKSDRLLAIGASSEQPMATWPLYRCLVYEAKLGDHLYVLSAGDWFRVDLAFRDVVYGEVEKLPTLNVQLPPADRGTDEATYNAKAAAAIGGLCLDKALVFDDGPDKMEICDVLTADGRLIHVKQRGSSSTLSHLFTQGVNCAERLLQDERFRREARAVAADINPAFADVLPKERPEPQQLEVSFVVITRSTRKTPLTLPFFSLVSLRAAARRLQAFGFRVSVAAVREGSDVA